MKISILSLGVHGTNENYGAVLQILAFQEYLKQFFEADVEVVNYYGLSTKGKILIDDNLIIKSKKFLKKIIKILSNDKLTLRVRKHEKFIKKYLNITKPYNYKNIELAKFNSDYYIAESDVIWDPSFRNTGFDKAYFLKNKCFENGKRIIYAASMGDIKFTEKQNIEFKEMISNLDKISVRESYAKQYIYDKFDIKVETLIDPTLLLDEVFYNKYIEKCNYKIKKPYIIVYFPAEKNDEVIECAEKYAKEKNLDIIYLCRNKIEGKNTKINFGIEEFLYYIKNSKAIFCDSFHGICFSVIYKKEFYAFIRNDGKKIEDICNRLELTNRLIKNGIIPEKKIDYSKVYEILLNERQQTQKWLTNIFFK